MVATIGDANVVNSAARMDLKASIYALNHYGPGINSVFDKHSSDPGRVLGLDGSVKRLGLGLVLFDLS